MKLKGKQREELKQECIELLSIDREIFEIRNTVDTAESIYHEVRRCNGKNIQSDLERLKRASDLLVSTIYHIKEKEKIWNELPKATWWYCYVGHKPKPVEVAVLNEKSISDLDYVAEGQTIEGETIHLSSERAPVDRSVANIERHFATEEIAIDWQKRSVEHQLTERPDKIKALSVRNQIEKWESGIEELVSKLSQPIPYPVRSVNEYTEYPRGLEERLRRR